MPSDLTTAARAVLAALDTYREQGQLPVCDVPACPHYDQCGTTGGERTHCPYFVPPQCNWLPVEAAAQALKRAVDAGAVDKDVQRQIRWASKRKQKGA